MAKFKWVHWFLTIASVLSKSSQHFCVFRFTVIISLLADILNSWLKLCQVRNLLLLLKWIVTMSKIRHGQNRRYYQECQWSQNHYWTMTSKIKPLNHEQWHQAVRTKWKGHWIHRSSWQTYDSMSSSQTLDGPRIERWPLLVPSQHLVVLTQAHAQVDCWPGQEHCGCGRAKQTSHWQSKLPAGEASLPPAKQFFHWQSELPTSEAIFLPAKLASHRRSQWRRRIASQDFLGKFFFFLWDFAYFALFVLKSEATKGLWWENCRNFSLFNFVSRHGQECQLSQEATLKRRNERWPSYH